MYSRSLEPLFLFLMLMLGKPGACGTEDNCTAAVNVKRNTEYHFKSGEPAIVPCPVTYCQKKPEIRWYKNNNHSYLISPDGQRRTFTWIDDNNFVLNFSSIHKNDSGLYHCESVSENKTNKGHYINLTVQDDGTNTTAGQGASKNEKAWIIYLLSSLGALCLIAVSCLGPLYFIWRNSVKNKTTSSVLQSEMNVLSSYSDVKYCDDHTIGVPDEGCVLHPGAATPGVKCKHDSSICDDQVSCWKAFRVKSNLEFHQSVTSVRHFPGEDQDMIVYASLSHGEHSQRHEPSQEIELTEYAAIGQKN